jgi:hypothetical protein
MKNVPDNVTFNLEIKWGPQMSTDLKPFRPVSALSSPEKVRSWSAAGREDAYFLFLLTNETTLLS